MSTFPGLIEEIPGISVDKFDGENSKSTAFFLSHCHTDHMCGLNSNFFAQLKDNSQFLYCTNLSKAFLDGKFELTELQLLETVKSIETCSPIIVKYQSSSECEDSITVLCVPAGHCPGSVMFIFENEKCSILYTGDFRISPSDLRKLKPLHYNTGTKMLPKKFDKIYLDTTFLSKSFREFPSRQQSLAEIIRVARDWTSRDPRNVAILERSALYGSEFVYMELRDALNERVHVAPEVYQSYSRVIELERCITNNADSTPIHACLKKSERGNLTCRQDVSAENILRIVVSALRWHDRDLSNNISEWDSNGRKFYVCLSMHSSYNELKAFLEYFKPSDVYACVQQKDGSTERILQELTKKCDKQISEGVTESKTYKLDLSELNHLKRPRVESKYFSDDSSE